MDRKQFMRDVYSGYWMRARGTKYGFMEYDKRLCGLIGDSVKPDARVLEVAIGTGYPIAGFLADSGYEIHGIDISPALIAECRRLHPRIDASVGDAEQLPFPDDRFDVVYCFHSTWYFPDLGRVIDEMRRVARPGRLVLFDLQNRDNPAIAAAHERRLAQVRPGMLPRLALHARNAAKVLLRRGNPNWRALVYEVPTYPQDVYDHLRRSGAGDFTVMDDTLSALTGHGSFPEHARLVIAVPT